MNWPEISLAEFGLKKKLLNLLKVVLSLGLLAMVLLSVGVLDAPNVS
jgi:hypothetical protein